MADDGLFDDSGTAPIPVTPSTRRFRDTFSSLGVRNYRIYMLSQLISNTSWWAMRIAIDWLVFELTNSVAAVGLTVAIQFGPMLVFGPLGGLIADRLPKRRLLMTTQSINAVLTGTLATLTLTGVVQVWQVYAVAFLLGCVGIVDSPTRAVFVHEMVGSSRLGNAISINASVFHLGGLVGPALSGVLIALVGAGWSIATGSVAACVVIIALASMRVSELLPTVVASRAKGQIREGMRYIRSKPTIFWPVIMLMFVSVFGMNLPVLLVAFADHVFESGAAGYGLYSSAGAVGALSGALMSARRTTFRLRTIMLFAGIFGLAMLVTGLAPVTAVFLLGLGAVGFTRLQFAMTAETVVQMSSNRAIRGRVMAVYGMIMMGGQSIGGPLMGWIAETWNVRVAMVISGAVPLLAAVVISVLLARSGRLSLRVRRRWYAIPLSFEVRPAP